MEELYNFHSTNNRIGVVPSSWNLFQYSLTESEILSLLEKIGFKIIKVDIIQLGRDLIGKSSYKRIVSLTQAPTVISCSTFVRWLYAQVGVELKVFGIDQSKEGRKVELDNLRVGDLIFSRGRTPQYDDDPNLGVGHIGLITEKGTVLHNTNLHVNHEAGVAETPLEIFYKSQENYRGTRRLLPESGFYVLEIPQGMDILYSSDVKRKILQHLK